MARAVAAREEETRRKLGEERLRIAREVHDVVAHAMVAINVQSGVAAHLIDADPEQARSALREIKATSGEALRDLRATLGVLRGDDDAAPLGPSSGLGDLDELAGALRAAGVDVRLDVERARAGAGGRPRRGLPDRAGVAHQRAAPRAGVAGAGAWSRARAATCGWR